MRPRPLRRSSVRTEPSPNCRTRRPRTTTAVPLGVRRSRPSTPARPPRRRQRTRFSSQLSARPSPLDVMPPGASLDHPADLDPVAPRRRRKPRRGRGRPDGERLDGRHAGDIRTSTREQYPPVSLPARVDMTNPTHEVHHTTTVRRHAHPIHYRHHPRIRSRHRPERCTLTVNGGDSQQPSSHNYNAAH